MNDKMVAHYEISSKLGEGGMGEVYRARDTKLDREVALKFLPREVATDPERLARFRREAKVLASLNHPNIAGVYGLHQAETSAGPIRFLTMELVKGRTLARVIPRNGLPLSRFFQIAVPPSALEIQLSDPHAVGVIGKETTDRAEIPAGIAAVDSSAAQVLYIGPGSRGFLQLP